MSTTMIIIPLPLFIMIMLLALVGVVRSVYYAIDENRKPLDTLVMFVLPTAYVLTLYFAVMLNI